MWPTAIVRMIEIDRICAWNAEAGRDDGSKPLIFRNRRSKGIIHKEEAAWWVRQLFPPVVDQVPQMITHAVPVRSVPMRDMQSVTTVEEISAWCHLPHLMVLRTGKVLFFRQIVRGNQHTIARSMGVRNKRPAVPSLGHFAYTENIKGGWRKIHRGPEDLFDGGPGVYIAQWEEGACSVLLTLPDKELVGNMFRRDTSLAVNTEPLRVTIRFHRKSETPRSIRHSRSVP